MRISYILRWWAESATRNDERPEAARMRAQVRVWAQEEERSATTNDRNPRFRLRELHSPPLALAWVYSHQEDKFPGEPPTPSPFVTGVNEAADRTCQPLSSDPARNLRPTDPQAGIRWPPGLPRFWISHCRRAPPGGVGPAIKAWARSRALSEGGAATRGSSGE